MMSRILAVLVTVLCIAFLGFAFVVTLGGPNWEAMARSMTEYRFTQDPDGKWSVTTADEQQLGSSEVTASVLVSALDDKLKRLQGELTPLEEAQPQLQARTEALEQQIAADQAALTASLGQKQQFLAQLQQQRSQISGQVVQQTEQANALEQQVGDRRADVFRLTNQLTLLRADEARIEQIHRQLDDLIEQINADLGKARRREEQLRTQLGIEYQDPSRDQARQEQSAQ
jgi:chromosome segregation ATPase